MPQIKLKRSLYIGLGGTGIKALLKTKKMFIDNYGDVPPMIQFLGFDTDQGVYERKDTLSTQEVYLTKAEQCSISVPGAPSDYYNSNSRELSWLPKENVRMIQNLDKGAGQVRTNGRLAFVYNVKNIETSINTAYTKCSSHNIIDNPKYAPAEGNVEVHIIFSIGGGTGCGTFLDTAYLIRKMFGKSVNMYGYAVLPKVFKEMVPNGPAMIRVFPNAYGALQDLDYLMHLDQNDEQPVTFNWIANSFSEEDFRRTPNPFDLVYLVDNTNARAVKYDKVDNLADVISLALVAASGEIGTTNSSIFDNVIKVMETGDLDVNNKKAWVACVGTADIVFKGAEVADIFANKAALRLIQRALNTEADCNQLATSWIDEVKIREDHGQDQVIDALCPKKPKFQLDISDNKAPKAEVEQYCESVIGEARKSAEKSKNELLANVSKQLAEAVTKHLNSGPGCVTTTNDFLACIKSQVEIFIGEMLQEKTDSESKTATYKQKLDIASKSLQEEANKNFIKRSNKRIEEYTEDTINAANAYVVNEIEIIRRLFALQFFNSLLDVLSDQEKIVSRIIDMMNGLKITIAAELNKRSASGRSSTMEIDLAEDTVRNLTINDDIIVFSDFYSHVGEKGLEGIETSDELKGVLMDYARSLPECENWATKTVAEVIDSLPEDTFMEYCRRAVEKAEPLLKIDGKGRRVASGPTLDQAIAHSYFICVEDRDNNRFVKSQNFQESIKSTQRIEFVSTGLKDRVIFYRQDFVVPAYAVLGVDEWRREYDTSKVSCHIDANLHQRMVKENYSIEPSDLNSEVLALWVKGFIFGMIKYDREIGNGAYTFYSKKTGKAANLYWVNTGTYYRNKAYEQFCAQSKEALEWFKNEIENRKSAMGLIGCKDLCDVVTFGANYGLHFSQYDAVGYNEVPFDVLKEQMRNNVLEKPVKPRATVSQAESIELYMKEVEYVLNQLAKEF